MPLRPPAGFIRPGYDPLKVPNAPIIGVASSVSPGSGQISVAFTAPSNVGGSAITSYLATARRTSDGTLVNATGTSSPIIFSGLVIGSAYTVTVVAINSYGPSASSAVSNSATPASLNIGDAYQGGYYAGLISTTGNGVADFRLVVAPVSSGLNPSRQWKTSNTSTPGTSSDIDGPSNSSAMNNGSHPAAQFCEGLSIGGYTDWYMPAKNELEICYFNLKPTTRSNNTSSGSNINAVPSRPGNYSSGNPSQTSANDFKDTGTEDFPTTEDYFSSTEASAADAWRQDFTDGTQGGASKNLFRQVRAVRRVAI